MAPNLKNLPGRIAGAAVNRLTQMANASSEIARALPDSKGGEEPKDLQRWRADAYTVFTTTIGQSVNFYNADQWVQLKFTLETAGNVAIGIGRSDIVPVLSGKGRLLTTNHEFKIFVPKGTRVYYAATSVNRVGFAIEPIPWMEQLSMEIRRVAAGVLGSAQAIVQALTGQAPSSPAPSPTLPGVQQRKNRIQELTRIDPPGKV